MSSSTKWEVVQSKREKQAAPPAKKAGKKAADSRPDTGKKQPPQPQKKKQPQQPPQQQQPQPKKKKQPPQPQAKEPSPPKKQKAAAANHNNVAAGKQEAKQQQLQQKQAKDKPGKKAEKASNKMRTKAKKGSKGMRLFFIFSVLLAGIITADIARNLGWEKSQTLRISKQLGVYKIGVLAVGKLNDTVHWCQGKADEFAPGYWDRIISVLQPLGSLLLNLWLMVVNGVDSLVVFAVTKLKSVSSNANTAQST